MIVLWLSELITDFGLGNGASLLIYINITSNLPNLLKKITIENVTIFAFVEIIVLIAVSFYGMIFLSKATRRIPLLSSKQLNQPISSSQDAVNSYLPLRFNQAGVMPIILTTTILVVPNYLINLGIFQWLSALTVLKSVSWIYWIGYFFLVLAFSSFYSSIVLNPKDMSDQLQKMSVTIPGVRPGLQTTFYLKSVIKRITLVGATMLAILTVVPNFLESTLNVTGLNGLSTTSFLILAGVILDLMREIENIFVSNAYNNRYQ
mmetsp:Transcript_30489/g.74046  ORF Transcript_30489/g.74046 Transcript_30489/m.74046 type:complete len:262 (-) Transcript_30489:472-1257(-)